MDKKAAADGLVVPPNSAKVDALQAAHGRAHLLAIGVDDYDSSSGFHALKVCVNDAITVRDRFLDIEQLNADKARCRALTSKSQRPPSRGEILRALRQLAEEADQADRLVLYFSGHGHRISGEFYLVPQDAFASDDVTALVSLSDVLKGLNASAAKQKLLVIDACLSGPDTKHLKATLADVSPKFLKEYLAQTSGVAILCSCGIDEESTIQSPNPKLSLFTHYFCEGLAGHMEALESGMLTLSSLYSYLSIQVRSRAKSYHHRQNPALSNTVQGLFLLGDFRTPLLQASALDLEQYPVKALEFRDRESAQVKDVLTEIKRWTAYSEQYLEGVVNAQLGAYFGDVLGKAAAAISKKLGLPIAEVTVDEASLRFPDGGYSIEYRRKDLKSGFFRHSVWFGRSWFDRPQNIVTILDCIDMQPEQMILELSGKRSLESMIAGVLARGWELESQRLPNEFTVKRGPYRMRCTSDEIRFEGFLPQEILGSDAEPEKQSLIEGVLRLLPTSN